MNRKSYIHPKNMKLSKMAENFIKSSEIKLNLSEYERSIWLSNIISWRFCCPEFFVAVCVHRYKETYYSVRLRSTTIVCAFLLKACLSSSGWPDWAIFCPLADCLRWAVLRKITEVAQIYGILFSTVPFMCWFWQNMVGLNFGRLFHERIWGRCYDHKFLRFFPNFRRKDWRFS
jgi:hypothetical protein